MSAEDFKKFERKAERRIDGITGNKLQFAFPTIDRDAQAVKDCVCDLTEFLYQVDSCQTAAMESVGTVSQPDGTIRGKVVSSISSGAESISYSAGSTSDTYVMEAAKDKKFMDTLVYSMVRDGLSCVPDASGIYLLDARIYW